MTAANEGTVHELIVTGPARDQLYERFLTLYAGHQDVRVIKDRRCGERRRKWRAVAVDRRRADRRRRSPTWAFPPE